MYIIFKKNIQGEQNSVGCEKQHRHLFAGTWIFDDDVKKRIMDKLFSIQQEKVTCKEGFWFIG